jgi:SAM-dependent methyltransferase
MKCGTKYEAIAGIPDLRYPARRDETTLNDIAQARELASTAQARSADEMVREFFAVREGVDGWTERETAQRTRETLAMPQRLQRDFDEWLQPLTHQKVFLDVGCGLGGLLAAAGVRGIAAIGFDNRLAVLVIAKRLIESQGGTATLACADAAAIPLPDEAVGGVVMYDVVEHIQDLEAALAEVSRVTSPDGVFACSTPNRFSIAPEPHVRLWGVGWLPRKYQAAYVRRRIGWDYHGTQLLSPRELVAMLERSTQFKVKASLAPIPASEVAAARGMRRLLARGYNAAISNAAARKALLTIGPFFQVTGRRQRTA